MTVAVVTTLAGTIVGPQRQTSSASPEVTLISRYPLDSGSASADIGSVNGTVVNTFTSVTTGSLVTGVSGTSLYKSGGNPHVTFPASQSLHDLSQLTLSFYYQPTASDAKHVLFAVGDGTAIGDFSIERLTNGRLRGYHVGQDAGLRFFEDATGIAATNLTLNTAYRITLTLGPNGVELYLNNTLVSTIPQNINGWNNSRVKYLGVWVDGSTTPAQGVFDHVRIWNGQLSQTGVNALEAAQSISLTSASTLQVPRVDLWLTNDDFAIPSTGTIRYATPGGSGVGGSTEGSAGALQTTLTASAAGDTVVCLQGYYGASTGLTFPAGSSATNPVTVMAKPGSWAVICQDTSFLNQGTMDAGAGEGSSKTWTLYDSATNTWRIPYSGGASSLNGCFFQNGMAHMLFPYPSLTALMSDRASGNAKPQTKDQYWFSGTAVSGAFAYIRLDRPNWYDMVSGSSGTVDSTYGAWPDDGRYTVGIEGGSPAPNWFSRSNSSDFKTGRPIIGQGLNPNNLRIYLAGENSQRLLNQSSGNFTRLGSGMNSMCYEAYTTGVGNHELHRGCHFMRGYFINTITSNVSNVTAHRARLFTYGEHRLQGSMAVMKYGEFLTPKDQMLQGSHRGGVVSAPYNADHSCTNVTFDNCTICYFHEVFVGGEPINKLRFVNCTFHMIYDEFGQNSNEKTSQVEVGYCYMRDSSTWNGASLDSSGTQSPLASEWYHHNIVDQRCPRSGFQNRRPGGGSNSIGRDINGQGATKKYNNTVIQNPDDSPGRGMTLGWAGSTEMVRAPTSAAQYDEIFNNIVIRHDTKRYNGEEGSNPRRNDFCEERMLITDGTIYNKCYRDYNLYYRSVPVDPATGSLSNTKYDDVSGRYFNGHNYDYVRTNNGLEPGSAVFYGSADYDLTVSGIGKAWEANSSDANPLIPSVSSFPASRMDYRPQNLSATTASATPPSGANWWTSPGWTSYGAQAVSFNMAPSPWKGALDPNGTTIPVGVQSP